MTKEALLQQLRTDTWVTLQPSALHGIGVFALRPIPRRCTTMFSSGVGEWIPVPAHEVAALPAYSRKLVETYCLYDADNYFIPDYGFKIMDMVNYLNHSDTPNIASVKDGMYFEALRDIEEGEELLVDYGLLVDPEL